MCWQLSVPADGIAHLVPSQRLGHNQLGVPGAEMPLGDFLKGQHMIRKVTDSKLDRIQQTFTYDGLAGAGNIYWPAIHCSTKDDGLGTHLNEGLYLRWEGGQFGASKTEFYGIAKCALNTIFDQQAEMETGSRQR